MVSKNVGNVHPTENLKIAVDSEHLQRRAIGCQSPIAFKAYLNKYKGEKVSVL